MCYFSAIPHHGDRFASENAFQDGARVACQIGGANDLHFCTSPTRDAQRYAQIHFIRIFSKKKVLTNPLRREYILLQVLLTGVNRFGPFGVGFWVSWICISVPFCAPTCMFSTKGKLHTKKDRGP
jgi:hypothetical protein